LNVVVSSGVRLDFHSENREGKQVPVLHARPEFSQNENSSTTRGEIKLSAIGAWSLVSLTTVSTCRLMEVFSAEQYLCSLEGNLLEELEDTQQVFVASLLLSDVLAGGRVALNTFLLLKAVLRIRDSVPF
jgi:hypothetical protein